MRRAPTSPTPNLPLLLALLALLTLASVGCGGASAAVKPPAPPTIEPEDAAAQSDTPAAKMTAPFPFRLPCEEYDLIGCTNGCNDKQIEDCVTLASMYLRGEIVSPDKPRAIELFKATCDDGSARGCMRLGDAYRAGLLVGDADETASYRKACDAGANLGCVEAGKAYLEGRGVPIDAKVAALLFGKVCDRGNAAGCFELGRLFESGDGVKKSDARSFDLYAKACHLGLDQGCLAASRTEEVAPPRY